MNALVATLSCEDHCLTQQDLVCTKLLFQPTLCTTRSYLTSCEYDVARYRSAILLSTYSVKPSAAPIVEHSSRPPSTPVTG